MAWDLSFKRALKVIFEKHGMTVDAGYELANSRQFIDFIIHDNNTEMQTPFKYAKNTVIGEFKSNRDKITLADFYVLLAKFHHYLALTHGYGRTKRTSSLTHHNASCVMVLGGKLRIPRKAQREFRFETIEQGIYQAQALGEITLQVLIIDEVFHYPLFRFAGLFGSNKTINQVLEQALDWGDRFIISVGYFLDKEKVVRLAISKKKPISPESLSIRDAVETIGIKKVIEEVGLQKVIEEVGLQKVIEEVGLQKVIEEVGLEKVVKQLLKHHSSEEILGVMKKLRPEEFPNK